MLDGDEPPALSRRTRAGIVRGVAAVAGFLAMAGLLRMALPEPIVSLIDAKRRVFETANPAFDTLFLGTSHLYRGVDPALFDDTMAGAGQPTRAFNHAVPGLRAVELRHLLVRLLRADEPRALRWVILDVAPIGWDIEADNLSRDRTVRWHDARALAFMLRWHLGYVDIPVEERLERGLPHLLPFLIRQTNLGLGAVAFQQSLGPERDAMERFEKRLGPHHDGFRSLDDDLSQREGEKLELLEDRQRELRLAAPEWPKRLKAQTAKLRETSEAIDVHGIGLLSELQRRVRAHGAEPIFIAPPEWDAHRNLRDAASRGAIDTFWAFDDPADVPELFEPSHRFDLGHLNERGVVRFTERLADALVGHIESTATSTR